MPQRYVSKFFIAVFTISIGSGFHHGYHTGITNIPSDVMEKWIEKIKIARLSGKSPTPKEVSFLWSLSVAMFSVGGILGACIIGYFADRWGRKKSLFWNNFIIVVAIVLLSCSKKLSSYELFMFGRLLAGLNAGISGGICPIYLTEIAPDNIRGSVASLYQLVVSIAILFSQIAGVLLGNEKNWSHMFSIALIPVVLQVIILPFCPESPKYLLMGREKERRAKKALSWYRGNEDIHDEMEKLKKEDELVKQLHLIKKGRGTSSLTRLLCLCMVISMGQQLCGINSIVYFSTQFFREKKIAILSATYFTIGFGVVIAAATILPVLLVDKIGRRILMLASFLGMACAMLFLSFFLILEIKSRPFYMQYFVLISVVVYLVAFSIGVGPIGWFITPEIFNYTAKSAAVSIAVLINWISNLLVTLMFLPLKNAVGYYAFLVFVILNCFFFCYVHMNLPETSKLSAIEIVEKFN